MKPAPAESRADRAERQRECSEARSLKTFASVPAQVRIVFRAVLLVRSVDQGASVSSNSGASPIPEHKIEDDDDNQENDQRRYQPYVQHTRLSARGCLSNIPRVLRQ